MISDRKKPETNNYKQKHLSDKDNQQKIYLNSFIFIVLF